MYRSIANNRIIYIIHKGAATKFVSQNRLYKTKISATKNYTQFI